MRKYIHIALLLLCSCVQDQSVREIVMLGTFYSYQSPEVQLYYTISHEPVQAESVTLFINQQSVALSSNGITFANPNVVLQPSDSLQIVCQMGDYTVQAWTRLPPAIAITSVSNTVVTVDPNSTGTPAFVLQWTALPSAQYSYVLQLESLDSNAPTIPFGVPAGRFDEQYSGPISQTGTILFDTDFAKYGTHRLTIYAIRKDLEHLYFYDKTDLRGLALLAPDNIVNAKGFVTAATSTTIELEIQ